MYIGNAEGAVRYQELRIAVPTAREAQAMARHFVESMARMESDTADVGGLMTDLMYAALDELGAYRLPADVAHERHDADAYEEWRACAPCQEEHRLFGEIGLQVENAFATNESVIAVLAEAIRDAIRDCNERLTESSRGRR